MYYLRNIKAELNEYLTQLKVLLYSLFVYLDINMDVVKILFWLIIIDTVLGIIKALRLEIKVSLKKLAIGFLAKLSVILIPMTLALIGKGLSYDFKSFVIIVLDILIVNEGLSIFGNIIAIRTKKPLTNIDFISLLLNKIHQYFKKLITVLLNNLNVKK